MTEKERAEWLARAIDDLLRGTPPPETQEPTDEELHSLLRVAKARLDVSKRAVDAGADHEQAIWQKLVARVEARREGSAQEAPRVPQSDGELLGDAITHRRKTAREYAQAAEKHRDGVWSAVQERIGKAPQPSLWERLTTWLRLPQPDFSTPPPSRTRLVPTGDNDIDGLIRVALARPPLRVQAEQELSETQIRVRSRMQRDPSRRETPPMPTAPETSHSVLWPTLAFGAAAVIVIAGLGPLPATGFAHHPAVEAAEYVGERIGVVESASAPPAPGPGNTLVPQDISAEAASAWLGVPVVAPGTVSGMGRVSMLLYPAGVTGTRSGVFVAIYESADGSASLAVYQEAAMTALGDDLSVPEGTTVATEVAGHAATYFEGSWVSGGGELTWDPAGTQTVVFTSASVRTVVQYTGPAIAQEDVVSAAGAFAG